MVERWKFLTAVAISAQNWLNAQLRRRESGRFNRSIVFSATGPMQIVAIGDLHVGSTMGLCSRSACLDDGNPVKLNRMQEA